MADLSLFPDINPNIEEVIKQQNAVSPEDVATEPVPEKKKSHREIFVPLKTNKKIATEDNKETNSVSLTVIEDSEDETQGVPAAKTNAGTAPVKGKYSHLAKARQKGLEKRRQKAAEKRLLKEKAKQLKELEKQKRREATKERNRIKARERYRRLKAEKEAKKAETKVEDEKTFKEIAPKNMSFKQFAKYMNQYERVKNAYETKRKKKLKAKSNTGTRTKPVERKIDKPKPVPFHPSAYPLAHLYNPANQSNPDYF